MTILAQRTKIKKIKRKELIAPTVFAIISISVFNNNSLTATFATPLDFKFFDFLKYVLFQFTSPSFFFVKKNDLEKLNFHPPSFLRTRLELSLSNVSFVRKTHLIVLESKLVYKCFHVSPSILTKKQR